ncbi:MAG: 3-hydroxyacyl-CoA dehydrogenase NAD-binding domain-containing protein [Candidatus Pacebacteria bacterium]|jgi:3-hydroxybutyryl-CoA dehydrogenase|nr:3-hydroxyacyl-CoA dehydrogenase NAD-binding domain-containing protein [Candidatus Paceibacterota bacterium]
MQPMDKIAVIGGGVMGQGIAVLCARRGYAVLVCEPDAAARQRAAAEISKIFGKDFQKGKITQPDFEKALKQVRIIDDIGEAAGAAFVCEAINEDLASKKALFAELDRACPPETILASNTSAITISEIARDLSGRERITGMHFMNPPFIIDLVEVAPGADTSAKTVERTMEFARNLGKVPVLVKDSPGFLLNRLLLPMINEAAFCLQEGIASKEDIDRIMKLGGKFPMGPLELADLIGLDVCLRIMEGLEQGFSDKKYRPCPLIREMVERGYLGRKTKKGFYEY